MGERDRTEGGPSAWSPARVSRREWLGLAAGLLALCSLFLPWTRLSAADPAISAALAELPPADVSRSVWRATFLGWFAPVLVAFAGVFVAALGQRATLRANGLPQLWLVVALVAGCATALAWGFADWQFGDEQRAFLAESGVAVNAAVGRYVGAAAVLLTLVAAALDVRAGVSRGRNRKRAGAR